MWPPDQLILNGAKKALAGFGEESCNYPKVGEHREAWGRGYIRAKRAIARGDIKISWKAEREIVLGMIASRLESGGDAKEIAEEIRGMIKAGELKGNR